MTLFDCVIRGGRVVDGSSPAFELAARAL